MAVKRTLTLVSKNTNDEVVTRNINNANPAATYQNLDTFLRAVNGLSTNTYIDGLVQDVRSLNEELAD